jgi:hypothetical protein
MQMVMKWWSYVFICVLRWEISDMSEWRGAESVGHRPRSSNFVTVVLYFGKWSKVESRFAFHSLFNLQFLKLTATGASTNTEFFVYPEQQFYIRIRRTLLAALL